MASSRPARGHAVPAPIHGKAAGHLRGDRLAWCPNGRGAMLLMPAEEEGSLSGCRWPPAPSFLRTRAVRGRHPVCFGQKTGRVLQEMEEPRADVLPYTGVAPRISAEPCCSTSVVLARGLSNCVSTVRLFYPRRTRVLLQLSVVEGRGEPAPSCVTAEIRWRRVRLGFLRCLEQVATSPLQFNSSNSAMTTVPHGACRVQARTERSARQQWSCK